MSKSLFAVIAAVILFGTVPAMVHAAASKDTAEIASFDGEIQIKVGDKLYSILPGGPLPTINPGDQVTVVSGNAVFTVNGSSIKASAGSGFTFSIDNGSIVVAPFAGSVTIAKGNDVTTVAAGKTGTIAPLKASDTTTVKKDDTAKDTLVAKNDGTIEIPLTPNTVQQDKTVTDETVSGTTP